MPYEEYSFAREGGDHTIAYLSRPVFELAGGIGRETRVLDVGCGNGYWAGLFLERGCTVVGIDLSASGIEIARRAHPRGRFELLPADDQLLERLGEKPFDLLLSTEVLEHLYSPRSYASGCFEALRPGGRIVCTTPYHGYLKNLAISMAASGIGMQIRSGIAGTLSCGAAARCHAF
jgi:2-polyprenyl-3-methyl-5-hydroxy-6-metoxy-1,4-benzoquinol methylase